MCGIVGAYAPQGLLPSTELFSKALDRMCRRGPDDAGIWSDSQLRLGQRRPAVLDLTESGHQPMNSADQRFVVAFNGEIYSRSTGRKAALLQLGGWNIFIRVAPRRSGGYPQRGAPGDQSGCAARLP
jgi:asparagine synthetase B (glutamine-hydrolysing)